MCSIRVSTEDQARDAFSLPEQKERLEIADKKSSSPSACHPG